MKEKGNRIIGKPKRGTREYYDLQHQQPNRSQSPYSYSYPLNRKINWEVLVSSFDFNTNSGTIIYSTPKGIFKNIWEKGRQTYFGKEEELLLTRFGLLQSADRKRSYSLKVEPRNQMSQYNLENPRPEPETIEELEVKLIQYADQLSRELQTRRLSLREVTASQDLASNRERMIITCFLPELTTFPENKTSQNTDSSKHTAKAPIWSENMKRVLDFDYSGILVDCILLASDGSRITIDQNEKDWFIAYQPQSQPVDAELSNLHLVSATASFPATTF